MGFAELMNTQRFGESGMLREGIKAPMPFCIPCLMHLSYLAFPKVNFLISLVITSNQGVNGFPESHESL